MYSGKSKSIYLLFMIVVVLSMILGSSFNPGGVDLSRAQAEGDVFLPVTLRSGTPIPSSFGVEMEGGGVTNVPGVKQAGFGLVRNNGFQWDLIEPEKSEPAIYHWEVVDEAYLKSVADAGMKYIATIKYTPSWAQKTPPYACGPVAESELDRFAQFLGNLVERYSAAPYRIKYWELGNEPDIDPSLVTEHNLFGCWGDKNDAYYGGGYYAQMLKKAYPAIKAADPQAKVLIGGLLMDCNPSNPPPGEDCQSSRFLEGILKNGGGDYFDIVSFHAFNLYNGTLQVDENSPTWAPRGGLVLGKANYIRELLANSVSGVVYDKQLFFTEGALLCSEKNLSVCAPPGDDFFEAQADYAVWLYVRNIAADIKVSVWFSSDLFAWRYNSLYNDDGTPRPVYYSIKFMTQELTGAKYIHPVTQYSNLRGYEFSTAGKSIWVMWAPDETAHIMMLPQGTVAVKNKYGNPILPVNGQITVNSPVYVEFIP